MRVRFPLYMQTIAMLILYLVTLVVLLFACFNARFGLGWDAAMGSPLGEKFESVAGLISSQLHAAKSEQWNNILKTYDDNYHVKFFVYDITGKQIAGETTTLPEEVRARVGHMGPPPPVRGIFHLTGPGPEPPFAPPPEFDREHKHEHGRGHGPGPDPGFGPLFGPAGRPPFLPPGPEPKPPLMMFSQAHGRFLLHTNNPDRFWLCARIHVMAPDSGFPIPSTLIAECPSLWQTNLLFDFQFLATIIGVVLGLSLIFWWPFIYRITSTLSRLTAATESIALGKFDTRVGAGGGDEIGRLSEAVDTMAERLDGYNQEQRRLLADISHELFSPLARLQLALSLLEEEASSEQQSHIKDIEEEVQEMNNLVTELIAYSKAGMQAKTPALEKTDLHVLVETVLAKLGGGTGAQIEQKVESTLSVMADKLLLERAISNVLRNSLRYAGEAGPIKVEGVRDGDSIVLTITDSGPGVNEEALKHLTEPFYRPEPSRNRNSGGFGLGLAIVKSCVEACGGALDVRNAQPTGLMVTIRLAAAK